MRKLTLLLAAALSAASSETPEVPYCNLVAKPADFKGKTVRVRGIYEIGFEKSILKATECPNMPTWLGLNKGWESKTDGPVRDRIKALKWSVPVEVVVLGSFRSDGKFGHMGAYSRYFLVDRFELVNVIDGSKPAR